MKMKKLLQFKKTKLAMFIVAFSFVLNVQAQNLTWAKNMGGTSLDNGLSIAVDASGNVYTTGYFQGTADFDPGIGVSNLTSMGGTDIFISKVSATGNFVWVKQLGGTSSDVGRSIKVDASGNVYTTGNFNGSVDFNPGAGTFSLTTVGPDDIFVSKLDASGNFVWAKQMGGPNADQGYAIALDASGNVYTTGSFNISADFNPGAATFNLFSSGGYDIFVSKLDVNGNFVWAKNMGSSLQDWGLCLTLDPSGNVYTSGYFDGTADFDPGAATFNLISAGARDIFISKLDASGNFVWAKRIGGGANQSATGIATDASGNVYTTGSFEGAPDFDPGAGISTIGTAGVDDIFVSKLDASGNFVWAKTMGSNGFDYGRGISIDASGNVLTTGEFYGTVDFDPGVGTTTLLALSVSSDIFVSKLDASGNFIWAKSIGSSNNGDGKGNAISSDATGNVYTTGYFSGTTDFDPNAGVFNLVPPGTQADVFVLKLGACAANPSPVNTTPLANLNRCQNESTTLSATGVGPINWYASPTSTTILSIGQSFVISLASVGSFTYYASTTSTCGTESNRTSFVITVNPLPTINVTTSNSLLCVGATANLFATGCLAYNWTPGGSSGFSISVSPSVTTSYTVSGLGSNFCSGSYVFTQNVSLCDVINQLTDSSNKLSIFPNPGSAYITIRADEDIQTISIFNALGVLVKTETINTFSVEQLSRGIYFLHIKTEKGTNLTRFIKE